MDTNNIKKIKVYVDKIRKFRTLKMYKDMSNDEFHHKMRLVFPTFASENYSIFKSVTHSVHPYLLDLMFEKMNNIEIEFNSRKSEIDIVKPFIRDAEEFIRDRVKTTKDNVINFFVRAKPVYDITYEEFIDKYPKIIDRLADEDYKSFNPETLLYEQIKFKHEVLIGEALGKQYFKDVPKK